MRIFKSSLVCLFLSLFSFTANSALFGTLKGVTSVLPIYKNGSYLASMTHMGHGIYLTAAHVLNSLDQEGLDQFFKENGIDPENIKIYQLDFDGKAIDAVIILDKTRTDILSAQIYLDILKGHPVDRSGFEINHLAYTNDNLLIDTARGSILASEDFRWMYIPKLRSTIITYGSSGTIVWQKSQRASKALGLAQCLVPESNKALLGDSAHTYIRVLSYWSILRAIPKEVSLKELKENAYQFMPEGCIPIGKDGGGG